MNATARTYFITSTTEASTPQATKYFDPFDFNGLILDILADRSLSRGASDILAELVKLAGVKGSCYPSIAYLSTQIRRCRTQVKLYLKELAIKGRIRVIHNFGQESRYYVLDIATKLSEPSRFSDHRKELNTKKTVREQETVISICCEETHSRSVQAQTVEITSSPVGSHKNNFRPDTICADPREEPELSAPGKTASKPLLKPKDAQNGMGHAPTRATPIRMDLVREILDLTGDAKSTRFWVKFVRLAPLTTVYLAISSLKIAIDEGIVLHPGKYLVGIIKRQYPEMFDSKKQPLRPCLEKQDAPYYPKTCESGPPVEVDWDLNRSGLRNIMSILERKTS
jgi:hypothetical protein